MHLVGYFQTNCGNFKSHFRAESFWDIDQRANSYRKTNGSLRLEKFRKVYDYAFISLHQLRSACIVESDPDAVSLYVQFLAHYTPQRLHDLADLCLDMSATVVERSTLLTAIMPGSMCKTSPRYPQYKHF